MPLQSMQSPVLEANDVSKHYGGVPALSAVSIRLYPGEIHALMGENGAGKSTLIKILSGSVRPDGGTVTLGGATIPPGDVRAAEAAGIATIHQESTAFPNLSAEDNVFAGHEPRRCFGLLLDRKRMHAETGALMARLGLEKVDTRRPAGEMPLASRQLIAMARALSRDSKVLILDEPTASLSARETDALFANIRRLHDEGVALLYVSHRMDEIFALADRITILRDGKFVDTVPTAEITREDLIRKMVGRDLAAATDTSDSATPPGAPVLEVIGLTRPGAFEDISLTVRAGEVVGLAGLVGAGRTEVARAIFGADRYAAGTVSVGGQALVGGSIERAIRAGVALVPEDRQDQGLVLPLSVGTNLTLVTLSSLAKGGVRSTANERATAAKLIEQMQVRAASPDLPAQSLSGGNQQKLVIGKWLAAKPRVLVLDEPTRGVDVGAKAEIYRLIRALARDGLATLVISSELPELLTLCDRIIVLRAGRIAGELSREDATEEKILTLALDATPAEATV
jgi:rhamnose transport system ATP-binding protein